MRYVVLAAGLLGTMNCAMLTTGPAGAQGRCPEGRTSSGACVNAGLAEASQEAAIVFAQPKLSYTAYPVLPTGDRLYRYPNQPNPDQSSPSPLRSGAPCSAGPKGHC
jgi:hypothetical protein